MMRKFSVLVVLFLSSVVFVQAQSTTTTEPATNPGGFIIKGGVNFANITTSGDGDINDANTLTSFNVGVLADVPLLDVLSLQPGIVFTGKGSKTSGSTSLGGITSSYDSKLNPLYIEVPVNAVVKLPLGGTSHVFFGAGPYGAVGVGGKAKVKANVGGLESSSDENIKFGDGNDDDLKRFDFGLNGLAGIEISRLVLGVNYGLGLSKIGANQDDNDSDQKSKYRVFSINVGVRF